MELGNPEELSEPNIIGPLFMQFMNEHGGSMDDFAVGVADDWHTAITPEHGLDPDRDSWMARRVSGISSARMITEYFRAIGVPEAPAAAVHDGSVYVYIVHVRPPSR